MNGALKSEEASRGTKLLCIAGVEREIRGRGIWRGLLGGRTMEEEDEDEENGDRDSMAGRSHSSVDGSSPR